MGAALSCARSHNLKGGYPAPVMKLASEHVSDSRVDLALDGYLIRRNAIPWTLDENNLSFLSVPKASLLLLKRPLITIPSTRERNIEDSSSFHTHHVRCQDPGGSFVNLTSKVWTKERSRSVGFPAEGSPRPPSSSGENPTILDVRSWDKTNLSSQHDRK